jgi:hypothetical protein
MPLDAQVMARPAAVIDLTVPLFAQCELTVTSSTLAGTVGGTATLSRRRDGRGETLA